MLFITLIATVQWYHWKYPKLERNDEHWMSGGSGSMERHLDLYPNENENFCPYTAVMCWK